MNKRLPLFTLLGLTLALAGAGPAPAAADTPAVALVRTFLANRAAGKYDDAWLLLSLPTRNFVTETQFEQGGMPPRGEGPLPAPRLLGVLVLLRDTHSTLKYRFSVIGPDPANPAAVLVRETRPAAADITLRMVTVTDPEDGTLRLDVKESLKQSAPQELANVVQRNQPDTTAVASRSNLNRLALGVLQYAQDHSGVMPDAASWVNEIMPYVKDKSLFHDPAAPASQAYSYAYNRTLSHQNLAALKNPVYTVMLFESSAGVKNASDTGQSVPRPGRHREQDTPGKGTNYAFADGHGQWLADGVKPSYALRGI